MNVFNDILKSGILERIIWTFVVILLGTVIYIIIAKFLTAKEKHNSKILSSKKNKTFLRMLKNIAGVLIAIVVILTILQIFGVNVSSMLAGIGIASIVIGFALQDAMKDVIRGLEIVSDSYYDVGDYIKFGDNIGEVLSIGLRTTKIQDMNTMNIVSISNRNIDEVEIVSNYLYLTVPLPYEIKPAAADTLLTEINKSIKKIKAVTDAEYQGLNSFGTSVLNYQIAINCSPADKQSVNRQALRIITEAFAAHRLRLPYEHIDIREK